MTTPTALEVLLEEQGPQTSASLLRQFEQEGASSAAARKRLQRVGPEVFRLQNCGLAKNQQLFYLKHDWLSARFVASLMGAWEQGRSAHAHACAAMPSDGAPLPVELLRARSGAPDAMQRQVGFDRVLADLLRFRVAKQIDVPELGNCILPTINLQRPPTAQYVRAGLTAERLVLDAFRTWLRQLGLVSYRKGTLRGEEPPPRFAQFAFDFVAPSYARPMATSEGPDLKPGFVVADIWLGSRLSSAQVAGIIRKTSLIRAMPRTRPFLYFLIADGFEKEALLLGKGRGLLFTTPGHLFGRRVTGALARLVGALSSAAETARNEPGVVAELFDNLSRIEGAAANLRGPLFELIVGHLMSQTNGQGLDIGRTIRTPNGDRVELDVFSHSLALLRVCECKGHGPGYRVSLPEVRHWLEKTVPRTREWLLSESEYRQVPQSFEYWTSAGLSEDAADFLRSAREKTKKYKIEYFDGVDVIGQLRNVRMTHLVETMEEHYLKHPMVPFGAVSDSDFEEPPEAGFEEAVEADSDVPPEWLD